MCLHRLHIPPGSTLVHVCGLPNLARFPLNLLSFIENFVSQDLISRSVKQHQYLVRLRLKGLLSPWDSGSQPVGLTISKHIPGGLRNCGVWEMAHLQNYRKEVATDLWLGFLDCQKLSSYVVMHRWTATP